MRPAQLSGRHESFASDFGNSWETGDLCGSVRSLFGLAEGIGEDAASGVAA